jgi:hypothetical protein
MTDRISVVDAAQTGDELQTLEAMRDRLAALLDSDPAPYVMAQASGRLMDVLERIAEIRPKVNSLEAELERRRRERGR